MGCVPFFLCFLSSLDKHLQVFKLSNQIKGMMLKSADNFTNIQSCLQSFLPHYYIFFYYHSGILLALSFVPFHPNTRTAADSVT